MQDKTINHENVDINEEIKDGISMSKFSSINLEPVNDITQNELLVNLENEPVTNQQLMKSDCDLVTKKKNDDEAHVSNADDKFIKDQLKEQSEFVENIESGKLKEDVDLNSMKTDLKQGCSQILDQHDNKSECVDYNERSLKVNIFEDLEKSENQNIEVASTLKDDFPDLTKNLNDISIVKNSLNDNNGLKVGLNDITALKECLNDISSSQDGSILSKVGFNDIIGSKDDLNVYEDSKVDCSASDETTNDTNYVHKVINDESSVNLIDSEKVNKDVDNFIENILEEAQVIIDNQIKVEICSDFNENISESTENHLQVELINDREEGLDEQSDTGTVEPTQVIEEAIDDDSQEQLDTKVS